MQAGLLKTGFARRYVAGRHSEMKRSGIELRGRTGIAPGSKAGRRWRNIWNKNKIEEDESDENL